MLSGKIADGTPMQRQTQRPQEQSHRCAQPLRFNPHFVYLSALKVSIE